MCIGCAQEPKNRDGLEELILVKHEMQWTLNFYMYMAQRGERAEIFPSLSGKGNLDRTRGRRAYAVKTDRYVEQSRGSLRECISGVRTRHRVTPSKYCIVMIM